jgi:transcriptional regulator with XRE-family HTH domain
MNNVRQLRRERDISQKELCASLGITQSAVSQWETGKIDPARDMVVKLADFFGVSTDCIYAREEIPLNSVRSSSKPGDSARDEQELLLAYKLVNQKGKQFLREIVEMARLRFPIEIADMVRDEQNDLRDALHDARDSANADNAAKHLT